MTQQLNTIYDLAYAISKDGEEAYLEQSSGNCGEVDRMTLNRIHVKLLAEKMKLAEPAPASMSDIVKLELMELLEAIRELWGDIGDKSYTDLTMLTDAKNLHQKALSICRIAGCNVDESNEAGVTSALPTQSKEGAVNAQPSLLEAQ
jgi:hypothetical protein